MLTIKDIKHKYKFAFSFWWNVLTKPASALQYNAVHSRFGGMKVTGDYIMPMSVLAALLCFIGSLLNAGDMHFERAVIKSIFVFISLVLSFYAQYFIVKYVTGRWFVSGLPRWNFAVMTASLMTVTFAVEMVSGLLPDMFFVSFLYVYVLYLVWLLTESVVPVDEALRNKYMVLVSIIDIVIPWLLVKLLRIMIPNIAY